MKAAIFQGPGKIEVQEVPEPALQKPDEAVVKITYCCICGSDLWPYRGLMPREAGSRIGHEFMGLVEAVGADVKNVKVGDLVVAPFTASDGTCPECRAGMTTACRHRLGWGAAGYDAGQGEKVRVPMADGTLFVIPKEKVTEAMMPALLPLSDVLCTGHHAAVSAGVKQGSVVAVVGDGAVGLCAVAASKRLGAARIFLVSTHPDRAAIGQQFGATDIVAARGQEAISQIKAATEDLGADCVLECVGTAESWNMAFAAVRAGGNIGAVGVPYQVPDIPVSNIFSRNVGVKGSAAPVAHYIPELMPDVLSGKLDVSAVFTKTVPLADIAEGYKAMDERTAVKVLVRP
ncbi:MAG TPA: alcohol dehydrogenase catalytic domain-containing protein [Patescibacteria group bacterium]|nr:alcohol dehydrogenase catalytic domain-containing protein [Patescibacteria group bacterium]